jgi:hypothetical protein
MPSNKGQNIAGGVISGAGAGFQMGGPWGAVAGAVVGGVLGALEKNPQLQLQKYDPADVTSGQNQFLQQGAQIGNVSGVLAHANQIDNASYQKQASQFAPNLMGNVRQNAANTSSLLAGQLPGGVAAATGKNGATARDLGLTSDQLMQQGAGQLGQETRTATGLNPFNETATSTLLSPSALLQRTDQANMYNLGIENQRLGAVYANNVNSDFARQALGMIGSMPGGGIGKMVGSAGGNTLTGGNYSYAPPTSSGYGFGYGDTGPTADSNFTDNGVFTGGYG